MVVIVDDSYDGVIVILMVLDFVDIEMVFVGVGVGIIVGNGDFLVFIIIM